MAIPEDKEWERKRGCFEGAHLCAITLRSSGWSWGLASGNWTTSHYTKGPSPSSLPFGVTWNWPHQFLVPDIIRNVTLDILHDTRLYFLDFYKTSRESCLRCMLQHVSDIQILIRRQILVNYTHLNKLYGITKFRLAVQNVLPAKGQSIRQADLSQVNEASLQIHQERAKNLPFIRNVPKIYQIFYQLWSKQSARYA